MQKVLSKIYPLFFLLLFPLIPIYVKASSNLDKFRFTSSTIPNVSVNDSYFNLLDYKKITTIKNQYNTNACWAFATIASIESNLLMNNFGYTDLSEAHLELSTQSTYNYERNTFVRELNTGGNYHIAAAYLMNSWGALKEDVLPFNKLLNLYNNNVLISKQEVINPKANYDVNSIAFIGSEDRCTYDTIKDIKEYLITQGALAATVYSDTTNVFKKYNYYNGLERKDINGNVIPAKQDINHGITIIGWDDTISKNKFATINPPTRDGAFIVKNSYGEKMAIGSINLVKNQLYNNFRNKLNITSIEEINDERLKLLVAELYDVTIDDVFYQDNEVYINIGYNGIEYISYDDIYICNNVVGFFDVSNEVEDYSYYYDDLGFNAIYKVENNTLYLANIFDRKSNSNEKLEEISMYFPKMGQKYEVYFANGEEANYKNAIKIGDGESNFVGYNTLNIFNKPIIKNKNYTILIKISDDYNVELGVSMPIGNSYSNMKLVNSKQFISVDGKNYTDVTNLKDNQFQLTVKAYTNKTDEDSNLIVHNNKIESNSNVLIQEKKETNAIDKIKALLNNGYLLIFMGFIVLLIGILYKIKSN